MIFSCKESLAKKKLNGMWYDLENEYSTWHFYPDSLVFKFAGNKEEKTDWHANNSEIKFEVPTFYWDSSGSIKDTVNKVLINYHLSAKKDSLYGTLKNNYGRHNFCLIKAKSYNEYLNKKFGVKFALPKSDEAESININSIYGMKIFMEASSEMIVGRTEISNSINNLEDDIKQFKDSTKHYVKNNTESNEMLVDSRFHMRVFADKSIPDSVITKLLKVKITLYNSELDKYYPENLRGYKRAPSPIKIYRIFENETIDPSNLKAKKIETIAYNIYI